jgi:hypothetical protein
VLMLGSVVHDRQLYICGERPLGALRR